MWCTKPPGLTNVCSCAPPRSTAYARSVIRWSHAAQRSESSSGDFVVESGADCSFATSNEVYHRGDAGDVRDRDAGGVQEVATSLRGAIAARIRRLRVGE